MSSCSRVPHYEMWLIISSEEDLSSKSGSGSSRGVLDVEPDSQRLQKTNERLEQECKRYQTQAAVHVKEMAQKAVLGKRHIRLLEEHDRLREKLRQAEWVSFHLSLRVLCLSPKEQQEIRSRLA